MDRAWAAELACPLSQGTVCVMLSPHGTQPRSPCDADATSANNLERAGRVTAQSDKRLGSHPISARTHLGHRNPARAWRASRLGTPRRFAHENVPVRDVSRR